jgi:hypothetical protein
MPGEVTSATARESRILLRAMDALRSIPYLLTFDSFEELLEIKPDGRGRRTRALGTVLILFTFLLVSCPSFSFLIIADINGRLS